ncbi:membrane bound c-di-GMP receptor LapD [Photobacterium aphoticum]|uniref:Membrane bound c-di-GMP receptor LapD n=1 Tax=Photobacterium aphoticum TaxID=754436 RepID=A0A090R3W6_9GAMM|nr:membrane bound c-di-GMP receptor LapD [Photobacterium aphoticum]
MNITQSSISDTGFIRWLGTKMKANPALRERILFELPEISFIKHSNDTDLLCEIIHQHAFAFGIDNFGHNFGSLHSLSTLRPAYVKLDFAYTNQIDDQAKADLLNSITRTTNNQGIILIASRVETHEQLDKLAALNVKGFQGFVVDAIHREKTQ